MTLLVQAKWHSVLSRNQYHPLSSKYTLASFFSQRNFFGGSNLLDSWLYGLWSMQIFPLHLFYNTNVIKSLLLYTYFYPESCWGLLCWFFVVVVVVVFWPCHPACGILVPRPRIEPREITKFQSLDHQKFPRAIVCPCRSVLWIFLFSLWFFTEYWIYFPVVYSRTLLFIYFI